MQVESERRLWKNRMLSTTLVMGSSMLMNAAMPAPIMGMPLFRHTYPRKPSRPLAASSAQVENPVTGIHSPLTVTSAQDASPAKKCT